LNGAFDFFAIDIYFWNLNLLYRGIKLSLHRALLIFYHTHDKIRDYNLEKAEIQAKSNLL
jgi:hypothetical protein